MQLVITLLESLTPYGTYAYLLMFAILIACGFGFPMPEDVILITGGILAARGVVVFEYVFYVTMLGVIIGDGTVFFLGKNFGPKLKRTRFGQKVLPEKREKKVSEWFARYGDKVIFFARFAPGLRTPLFFTAGTFQVPYWKFLALDGFAALISVPVWIWVGKVFGDNLEVLEEKIHQFQAGMYVVVVAALLCVFAMVYIKKRLKSRLES